MSIWDYFTEEERERICVRYANNPPRDGYQPSESPGASLPPPMNPASGTPYFAIPETGWGTGWHSSETEIPVSAHKLNADQTVAVATDVFWNEDMTTAPRGTKCQLLGAGGVATYGTYHGDTFWQAWAPLPKRRPRWRGAA